MALQQRKIETETAPPHGPRMPAIGEEAVASPALALQQLLRQRHRLVPDLARREQLRRLLVTSAAAGLALWLSLVEIADAGVRLVV